MRVELTQFCQDFTAALRPLSHSLDESIVSLHELDESAVPREMLSAYVDIQHRLKILTDKAEQQHAYLLIFGPLKSGKSTLMNAISGAYVSEVSSLPAYPCLVYVHEGEPRQCSITLFDGTKESFENEESLQARIEQAHVELAEQLRQADREQRPFNPAIEYPRAIRRVDYVVPAPNLRQSGTILVDTPGLYTKMRYNYEQLTRDFRHNAACAVFVVKPDNLFFDQVFDEFKDLLGVFSRIFLVVNIDSSKQDLGPGGALRPALESREPRRIVQAFEDFTASAQLREAIESRQLQIYLVDLLKTARRSLSGENLNPTDPLGSEKIEPGEVPTPEPFSPGANAMEGNDTATAESMEDRSAAGEPPADHADHPSAELGFEAFLRDLTRYLNSSDYIVEFMADSLRQSEHLVSEIRGEMGSDALNRFQQETDSLQAQAEGLARRLGHVDALQKTQWDSALQQVGDELEKERQKLTEGELQDLRSRLEAHVADWFGSEQSLQELIDQRLLPEIKETDQKLRGRAEELARERFQQRNSGLKLDAQTVGHLHKLDLSIDALYRNFSNRSEHSSNGINGLPAVDLRQDDLPVKKRFIDWITFRSPRVIRRNLLGPEEPSDRPLSPGIKAKRLGDAAREHLLERIQAYIREGLQDRDRQALQGTLQTYGSYFVGAIRSRLDDSRKEIRAREQKLRLQFRSNRRVLEALNALASASDHTLETADDLRRRFVSEESSLTLDNASSDEAEGFGPPRVGDIQEDSLDPAEAAEMKDERGADGVDEEEGFQDLPAKIEHPGSSGEPR